MIRKLVAILLSLIIGSVFIFSAISKIPTLQEFGWTIVETTFLGWTSAELLARIMIGIELFLGLLFIFHFKLKKIAIPISLLLLTAFNIYLSLVIYKHGDGGNCGCFGEVVSMTPLESIWKNIALIVAIFILLFIANAWNFKFSKWVIAIVFVASLILPFALFVPECFYIEEPDARLNKPIPLSILYQSDSNKAPILELRSGKHIINFMSSTCSYCRMAAKRIKIMKQKNPSIPFYVVLNGDSAHVKEFFEDTKMTNIPYSIFNGVEDFVKMNEGTQLPTIKWVEDTTLVRESNFASLNEKDILNWLHK
ncbi:MAG: MauE/DoxX family redox-associated membrane protein [Chitinophagaceae bacterium]